MMDRNKHINQLKNAIKFPSSYGLFGKIKTAIEQAIVDMQTLQSAVDILPKKKCNPANHPTPVWLTNCSECNHDKTIAKVEPIFARLQAELVEEGKKILLADCNKIELQVEIAELKTELSKQSHSAQFHRVELLETELKDEKEKNSLLQLENCKGSSILDDLRAELQKEQDNWEGLQGLTGNIIEELKVENEGLKDCLLTRDVALEAFNKAKQLVSDQAEDGRLWFKAKTAPEAYLQNRLRELHAIIEREYD